MPLIGHPGNRLDDLVRVPQPAIVRPLCVAAAVPVALWPATLRQQHDPVALRQLED